MRPRPLIDGLEPRRLLAAGFQIELAYEASVASSVRTVIQQAATRWQQVITGDIADVGAGSWGAAVDDIRITARVKAIDGAGNGVAQARPLYIRNGSHLPIAGEIEIDSADIASQTAAGTLLTIVTHEIGHALGFGTIWSQFGGLTTGLGGSNPLFLGSNALREYRSISGQSSATGVPLENTGSTGTRDAHWRESILKTELMTGFLGAGLNPLSRITIGQFQDLGYTVNYSAADAFSLGTTAGTVTGIVFNDLNKNGVKDATESGLPSATVYADRNWNGAFDSGEPSAAADSSGNYSLKDLAPGTYSIRPLYPTGTIVTAPSSGYHTITVTAGQTVTGRNFGIASNTTTTAGSISGNVFNDANGNGNKDSGEGNLGGVAVFIDANWNNKFDAGEKTTTTDSSGNYTLSNVNAGGYSIRVTPPSGGTVTSPASGYLYVSLTTGQALAGRNFGIRTGSVASGASVSGSVFSDANSNGTKDAGEGGLGGVTVFVDANWNNRLDAGEKTATTDASGNYTLSGLASGGYSIRSVAPSGGTLTSPASGYHYISLAANQALAGRNFGYRTGTTAPAGGTISGFVFKDANRNGQKDGSEAGLSNYIIFIDADYDGVRDANEKFTTSTSTGAYSFTGLAAGGYSVRIVPNGATIVNPSSTFWWITLGSGGSSTGRNYAIA